MDLSTISLLPLMPPNLAADRNVKMIAEAFDEVVRKIISKIPGVAIIPNLVLNQIANEMIIDLLAWQFHVDFYKPEMPIETKRALVLKSLDWHTRKGTPSVVEEIVSTVFSKAEIQEWFDYGGLPYRFRIGTVEELPDEETRENLRRAIASVKNTRSFLDTITSILYFEDAFAITDYLVMVAQYNNGKDYYGNRLQFNGAAKFDGVTQNKWIYVNGKFDGKHQFNGELSFGGTRKFNGNYKFNGKITFNGVSFGKARIPSRLLPPFKFSSWIVDSLELSIGNMVHEDTQRADLRFDGSVKFDGGSTFNGISQYPINSPLASRKDIKFNGGIKYDGNYQFNGVYGNKNRIGYADTALSDVMAASDGVLITTYQYHHFNGANKFDGSIPFDGIPSVMMG
jgi:phage tail P2-like protein